ncbi:MAG: YgiQ family radical SAM protein [Ruminococcaceae bacterium]|nr:YgiQ family radical SAM protein [Oscillospiraceae bacterium]
MPRIGETFLPVTKEECDELGWSAPDFVYVTGDAYVDHPSFGTAIISRVLEAEGFRVAILSQPDYKSCEAFKRFGRPRLGFLVSAGNIDSMVAHYTASKKKRSYDYYSPGGKMGLRPDRATIVYSNRIREAYGDIPIILGGLEASLRRFSHYDYWENRIRRSVLVDSRADILTYGMGENILVRIAKLLDKGVPIKKIHDVRGTVYLTKADDTVHFESVSCPSFDEVKNDKKAYAKAFGIQYREQDSVRGRAVTEMYDDKMLVQNPPMPPLEREELDRVYALPYTRKVHPMYAKDGGVPGIQEVEFSITHNRGCFGACNFCALAFHQGRSVRSRSIESVVGEAKIITEMPGFKGYIHDIGGPTANFRYPACDKQLTEGVCAGRKCLTPTPCKNLKVDHSEYIELLKQVESLSKIKKVFIRSGIRFDYLIYDNDERFFKKLVKDHVSGQLKVAPEHCSDNVLKCMGKPVIDVYEKFRKRFFEITKEVGKEQYLVPYLMSSHPGSRLSDAVALAEYLKKTGCSPEQVQDYYPTPGTASTVMFYTGYDPLTMKEVFCESDYHGKTLQRALLQFNRPENADLVREALRKCGREDLIGNTPNCLVRPNQQYSDGNFKKSVENKNSRPDRQKESKAGKYSGKSSQNQANNRKTGVQGKKNTRDTRNKGKK